MPFFRNLVILFTRYPRPGHCKSRLIPTLGKKGASRIHKQLVDHSLTEIQSFLTSHTDTALHIYYHGSDVQQMQAWLGDSLHFLPQQGDDLGERMANALGDGLQQQKNIILMGSDCPDITPKVLAEALTRLQHNDLVIGPAHDGGYYLIAVTKSLNPVSCKALFKDIHWGSDSVFSETLNRARHLNLKAHILATLHDIDTPEDLKYFHHCPHPQ